MSEVTVEYTESIPHGESSLIEGIFYNANDSTVTFDLSDRIYRYSNIKREDVMKVARAVSAGSEYQNFKRKFGPGESLGDYENIDWKKVGVNYQVSSNRNGPEESAISNVNIDIATSNELRSNASIYTSAVNASTISITPTAPKPKKHKVGFTVNNDSKISASSYSLGGGIKHHTLLAISVEDAVRQMSELAHMLGVSLSLKEVTVYFE
jgi:hypothetical protein